MAGSSSVAPASTAAVTTAAAENAGGLKFGDTHTWEDGLAVTVSKPTEFTPDEYAVGAESEGTPQLFEVTVKNGTDKPVEAMGISIQASSGGAQNDPIFDSASGIEVPTVAIQPGKSLSWKMGFNVADPADLTLDVSTMHDFTAEKVYFTAK